MIPGSILFSLQIAMETLRIMILICVFLFCSQHFVGCSSLPSFTELSLTPANASEPESLAFDPRGGGPYAGVVDGRILKYEGPNVGFVDFATTSPLRTKKECDGSNGSAAVTCGRPLGLGFDRLRGDLYVLDSGFGFQVVPPSGGLGTPIATGYNGTRFSFLNALDIDNSGRNVYFTDAGTIFLNRNLTVADLIRSGDTSGQLYKYNTRTGKLTYLLGGLSAPFGLAVSKNGEYLVISDYINSRIRRFWLKGPRAYRLETLVNLPGRPDNIRRTKYGDFWVAVAVGLSPSGASASSIIGIRFNGSGSILESLNLTAFYNGTLISEVHEYARKVYVASTATNFVGVYGTGVDHLRP